MAEGGSPTSSRESPPKAVVDTSPLHIDQNKESLKVKLMLRRPLDQLVAQGIMPPHKTPAAYHGQRRQLERAKTGDMLKAKIQQRPSRQELERRHILESDPAHLDPSLAERQRMLKKAKLADQLNDQLSHRPGPLELIRKNILHTEEPIEEAVKTGRIPYKATSEGQLNRPIHPSSYITPEEDSQSSEGDNIVSPGPSDVLETAAKSAGIVVSLIPASEGTVVVTTAAPVHARDNSEIVFADLCRSVAAPLLSRASAPSPAASVVSSTSTLSPQSSIASPVPSIYSQPATPIPQPVLTPRPLPSPAKSDAPGKDKNRKKSKSKSTPKTRTIKFHEYKGPPSAHKQSASLNNGESSYDLLLQQQTLLLQFQLQLQHKYPQIILPASTQIAQLETHQQQHESGNTNSSSGILNTPLPSPAPSTSSESSTVISATATNAPTIRVTNRLEDMKVSDLKAELKRRNLPVSGSKPQLIERLKLFTGQNESVQTSHSPVHEQHSNHVEQSVGSPQHQQQECGSPQQLIIKDEHQINVEQMEISPVSPAPEQLVHEPFIQHQQIKIEQISLQKTPEDIVKEQQMKIEELQRELTLSQLKLQAATRVEPKAQVLAYLQARQQQQQATLQLQQLQQLQAKQAQFNEEQQRLQQQQHEAFQNQKNLSNGIVLNSVDAALVFNQLLQEKAKIANGHTRANSLPSFFNTLVTPIITAPQLKVEQADEIKAPPQYEEATKQKKNNVKSQIVDDVLEILIKNGELPASAAQIPVTPNSAETNKTVEPHFPSQTTPISNNIVDDPSSPEEAPLEIDPNELLDSLDNLENMDLSQLVMELEQSNADNNNHCNENSVPMDTDDWLESLMSSSDTNNCNGSTMGVQEVDLYDPLLANHDPFDPFNLEEFRSPADLTAALSWDN